MSETSIDESTPPSAGRREWTGLAVLVLPALIIGMDLTVLHLAVPAIAADLRPSSSELLWIMDVYGFVIAPLLVPMGKLADKIGRRRLLLIGATVFGLASLLAAFAPSSEALIAARALLGVAGATIGPSTLSLIRNMFHDQTQRNRAISVWGMSTLGGNVIGPLLGGLMLEHFWWGSVLLLALPVMVLLLVAGPILLPEYRDTSVGRIDLASAVLAVVAVLGVIYGIQQIAQSGPGLLSLAAIAVGVVVGVLFVLRQRRLADPMLDVGLLSDRTFGVSLFTLTIGSLMLTGTGYFGMQFMQLALGLSTLEAGLWLLPILLFAVVATMMTPKLATTFSPGSILAAGMALSAVGFLILTRLDPSSGGLAVLVVGYVVIFVGLAPATMLTIGLMVGAAPPERAGAASAMSETTQQLGGALGLAVFGSIGTAVYRSSLGDGVLGGLPASVAESARNTLGEAAAEAARLGGANGDRLLGAARDAFSDGVAVTTGISAVVAAVSAVAIGVLLRSGGSADGAESTGGAGSGGSATDAGDRTGAGPGPTR
ncbi:MFS transporter [Pseudonocardia endophytica]|uniref:DHA2 family multidrug resistance protein-like MFS transporter n=1 Tax=Pseudonocardia endophytica TaxID=401976 RepID=A0A4R1HJG1_PSEEN|nr:MFS transporter [Pseudonocardia endophytica]TCK22447.1 DHA2 family multidrug resistance protein-like MFS transporter [Pseudonocardia endophytica]